jgi:hypothetical protein
VDPIEALAIEALPPDLHVLIVLDRARDETDSLLRRPREQQSPVADDAVAKQTRCPVQQHDIETFTGNDASEIGEKAGQLGSWVAGTFIRNQDGDVNVAFFADRPLTCEPNR